jgi:serine/threonine protein kinase
MGNTNGSSFNQSFLSPMKSKNIITHIYTYIHIVSKNFFEFRYVIGKGGFGKVWKVICKKTQKVYALKQMSKVKIIDKKSENSIKTERLLLSKLHHP